MTNNNRPASILLTNAHGAFRVDPEVLSRAIEAKGLASIEFLRHEAAGAMGFTPNAITGTFDDLDDCTRIEVLIAWVESGNHPF